MQIDALVPDVASGDAPLTSAIPRSGNAFAELLDAAGGILARADDAERAFAARRGGLQEMVVERARADIALQLAAASAQRVAQGLQTLLGMQI